MNRQEIDAAINSTTNPIEELRAVRNFVAHRGESSAHEIAAVARAFGVPGWRQPADMLNRRGVVERWCSTTGYDVLRGRNSCREVSRGRRALGRANTCSTVCQSVRPLR